MVNKNTSGLLFGNIYQQYSLEMATCFTCFCC